MSYLDIINVICFYFAYSTLSPSSTLLLFSLMPFQKEPASWDLPFHPISSTQAQKRLQRKVFTKRVENHWQMLPRGVVDAHPWKCSVWGSCSNWIWSCSLWGSWTRWPWKIPFNSNLSMNLWFMETKSFAIFLLLAKKQLWNSSRRAAGRVIPERQSVRSQWVWLLRPGSDHQGWVYQDSTKEKSPSWSMLWEKLIECTLS